MCVGREFSPENVDPLLRPFLEAADEGHARQILGQLVTEYVRPLAREIVRSRLRTPVNGYQGESLDPQDITSEVVLQVVEHLSGLRTCLDSDRVASLRGYVASITHNSFNHYLRQKYPERSRLKNRVRYALNHEPGLALWQDVSGTWLGGLAIWRGLHIRSVSGDRSPEQEENLENQLRERISAKEGDLRRLLPTLFRISEQPFELNALVDFAAKFLGIQEPQCVTSRDDGPSEGFLNGLPDRHMDIATAMEQKAYLQELWREICDLRPRQRAVLLLNLRDHTGQDILPLFPLTGTASLRQIAASLEMDTEAFAKIWERLPMDDLTIADRLGVTRQQVINLRKSARERLGRRMASGSKRPKTKVAREC